MSLQPTPPPRSDAQRLVDGADQRDHPLGTGLRVGLVDLGAYSVETFCQMTGYNLALTTGIRERECTALRRRWGKDSVRCWE